MGIILIMAVQVILAAESNAQVSNAEQYGRLALQFNVARRNLFLQRRRGFGSRCAYSKIRFSWSE